MRQWALGACLALWAGVAMAADQPLFGPVPDWVQPAAPRADPPPPGDAPYTILLLDQQFRFGPDADEKYSESQVRIDTPQGLSAVGSIGVGWQPEIQTVTIHKAHILRDGREIDLLQNGQTFTVLRRENNLEYAMLDGALTAVIQPEGLRVGDIVRFSTTVSDNDPVLAGASQAAASAGGAAVDRLHVRAEWDAARPIHWRGTGLFADARERRQGRRVEVRLEQDGVQAITPPAGAPLRYSVAPALEFGSFGSWRDVSALMAPLYAEASALSPDSPLHEEIARIRAAHDNPRDRAQAALRLVQDQVRYLYLGMDQGRLIPASADDTWSRRFGDCKGKTALLLALLHGLGVEAAPVAVHTFAGDGLNDRPPMVGAFDHVVVRAVIEGETYWLDGARTGDRRLSDIVPPLYHWGLPLTDPGSDLTPVMPGPMAEPTSLLVVNVDFSSGIEAPGAIEVESVLRGDTATLLRQALAALPPARANEALREIARDFHSEAEWDSVTGRHDDAAGHYILSMTGTLSSRWVNDRYRSLTGDLPAPGARHARREEERDIPYAVNHPVYSAARETVLLPRGGAGFTILGEDVSEVIGGVELRRATAKDRDTVTIETTMRSLAPEYPGSEHEDVERRRIELARSRVHIVAPQDYRSTEGDIAALEASEPEDAEDHIRLGLAFLGNARYDEAISAFDAVLGLEPDNAYGFANRGLAWAWKDEPEQARRDLEAALALDPDNPVAFRAYGVLAMREGRHSAAAEYFTLSLEADPDNGFAYAMRAQAHLAMNDHDAALSDAQAATRLSPENLGAYVTQFSVHDYRLDQEAKLATANAAIEAIPDNSQAYMMRAEARALSGDHDQAIADLDHALSLEESAGAYAMRAQHRMASDIDGARADLEAALALDPAFPPALAMRADLDRLQGDTEGAMASFDAAVEAALRQGGGVSAAAYAARANARFAMGDNDGVLADTAEALRLNPRIMDVYLLRSSVHLRNRDFDAMEREAETLLAAHPGNVEAVVLAGRIYDRAGRAEEAERLLTEAIERQPSVFTYQNRADIRLKTDIEGARRDLEAAMLLGADTSEFLFQRAAVEMSAKNYAGAVELLSTILTREHDGNLHPHARIERAIAYLELGQDDDAAPDLAAIRESVQAPALNNLCWGLGTRGMRLEEALADCNAAIMLEDSPIYRDSRGFVLVKLERYEDAIEEYDRALETRPDLAHSLYGRGVAKTRLGRTQDSLEDMQAAIALDSGIAETFGGYGLIP